jgi:hypothetical protein
LQAEGLAQEAKGKAGKLIGDASPAVKTTLNDHTISIVAAIAKALWRVAQCLSISSSVSCLSTDSFQVSMVSLQESLDPAY